MAKKLYVAGLSYSTTEDSLRSAFSKIGTVESVNIITDRTSGRSKGFGFVQMVSDEDAKKAMEAMNGKEFEGRTIIVNEARPLAPRSQRRRDFGGGGMGFGRDNRRRNW